MDEVQLYHFASHDQCHYSLKRGIVAIFVFYLIDFAHQVHIVKGEHETELITTIRNDSRKIDERENSTTEGEFQQLNLEDLFNLFPNHMTLKSTTYSLPGGLQIFTNVSQVLDVTYMNTSTPVHFYPGTISVTTLMNGSPPCSPLSAFNENDELVFSASACLICSGSGANGIKAKISIKLKRDESGNFNVLGVKVSQLQGCRVTLIPNSNYQLTTSAGSEIKVSKFNMSQYEQEISEHYLLHCQDGIEYALLFYTNPESLDSLVAI